MIVSRDRDVVDKRLLMKSDLLLFYGGTTAAHKQKTSIIEGDASSFSWSGRQSLLLFQKKKMKRKMNRLSQQNVMCVVTVVFVSDEIVTLLHKVFVLAGK
jgi:hypothetical protein